MTEQRRLNITAPPGGGKTRRLTQLAYEAMRDYGMDRVALITFTKAAAEEARTRLAFMLGIKPEEAKRKMPWVGTIHSLAYRLLGSPDMCDKTRATPYPDFDAASDDDYHKMRLAYSGARHRMVEDWKSLLPPDVDRKLAAALLQQFQADKQGNDELDFEDLLELAITDTRLPVDALFVDESQDNSPLLWGVIDAWSADLQYLVCAGDAYQAIFSFAGADPGLFMKRRGDWLHLPRSHRLRASEGEYAKEILRKAGWENPEFLAWWGVGFEHDEYVADWSMGGTTFYLARTHSLLGPLREDLMQRGIPFDELRGEGPWTSPARRTYIIIKSLLDGNEHTAIDVWKMVTGLSPGVISTERRKAIAELAKQDKNHPHTLADVEQAVNASLPWLAAGLPYADYFNRVHRMGGLVALSRKPTTSIGTVHAAKGKEADDVFLVRSWGILPAEAAHTNRQKEEALVAYVAASRHRHKLTFISGEGHDYPWPKRDEN